MLGNLVHDELSQHTPEEDQHNTDRSAGIQSCGQYIFIDPGVSVRSSGTTESFKHTVVLGPEREASPPDQVLEYKPDHSPRNVIQS